MSAPTEDLIARMTECRNGMRPFKTDLGDYGICTEAAQALRALQQEVERLREAMTEILYEDSDKSDTDRIVTRLKARSALTGGAQG